LTPFWRRLYPHGTKPPAARPGGTWWRFGKPTLMPNFVDPYTVFNIKGGAYRLIVKIEYRWQKIFVKHVLTHAEYDRNEWKK
jgi:hypothetical protein